MRVACTALLLSLAAQVHAAPRYALEALPPTPSPVTKLVDINNAGQIAVYTQVHESEWRGLLYTPGKPYTRLEPHGSYHGPFGFEPHALNDRGEVAGSYLDSPFVYRPDGTGGFIPNFRPLSPHWFFAINNHGQALGDSFLMSPYLYTPFKGWRHLQSTTGEPEHPLFLAHDLSNTGQVLFSWVDASVVWYLALRDIATGTSTNVAALTDEPTYGTRPRVNDSGLVAAAIGPTDRAKAVLFRAGRSYDLWRLTGQPMSTVLDLNANGSVLGTAFSSAEQGAPRYDFLFIPGEGVTWPLAHIEPTSRTGWTEMRLAAINDVGQVAGTGIFQGQRRMFVLNVIAP